MDQTSLYGPQGAAPVPAMTQLQQLLQQIPRAGQSGGGHPTQQTQGGGTTAPQSALAQLQSLFSPNGVGTAGLNGLDSLAGSIGGLMGGSGAAGGLNSLGQGLGFAAAPAGAMGPFTAGSSVGSLASGAGDAISSALPSLMALFA